MQNLQNGVLKSEHKKKKNHQKIPHFLFMKKRMCFFTGQKSSLPFCATEECVKDLQVKGCLWWLRIERQSERKRERAGSNTIVNKDGD